MYDEVICRMPLPNGADNTAAFQTKDLDCELDRFEITESGRLLNNGSDLNYHGWLNFYRYQDEHERLIKFRAKFTDGQCVEIVEVT